MCSLGGARLSPVSVASQFSSVSLFFFFLFFSRRLYLFVISSGLPFFFIASFEELSLSMDVQSIWLKNIALLILKKEKRMQNLKCTSYASKYSISPPKCVS